MAEGRSIAMGGQRFDYRVFGQGPALLQLPGTGGFLPPAQRAAFPRGLLDRHFRVLSLSWPPARGLRELVAGALGVMDAEGVGRAAVLGSSFGGYVAQAMARAHPERVGHLVLVNAAGPTPAMARAAGPLTALARLMPAKSLTRRMAKTLAETVRGPPGHEAETRAAAQRAFAEGFDRARILAAFRCSADAARRGFAPLDAQAWKGRVLIVEADDDPSVKPEWRAALRALHPGASVVVLRGAGHTPEVSRPEAFAALVRDFVAGKALPEA